MFEARHAEEHNSRPLSSNEHIDLPVRPTIIECSEEHCRTTYFSDQEDLMELMYIADTPAQQRHIRLFLNREYGRRIEWLYTLLAETIREATNVNVRRLLIGVQSGHFYHAWYKFTHYFYPAISAGLNFSKATFI